MPINDPVDGFPGERSTDNNLGGTCPLCGEDFKATLANHLEHHCEAIPEFEWDRQRGAER